MSSFKSLLSLIFLIIGFSWKPEATCVELDEFHICTVASDISKAKRLLASCKRNSISIDVLGVNEPYLGNGQKLLLFKNYVQQFPDHHVVMCVDAYDVIVLDNKQTILSKFLNFQSPFVIAAEKNCWPFPELAASYPQAPTPFRFINAGSYIGYVGYLKLLFSNLQPHPSQSDQGEMTKQFLKDPNLYKLDYYCHLFLPLFLVNRSELEVFREKSAIFCKATNSWPSVLHGNGPGRKIWNQICAQLGLDKD